MGGWAGSAVAPSGLGFNQLIQTSSGRSFAGKFLLQVQA